MRKYQATITAGRWPYTVTVEASSWGTASARAVKAWQKRFKGDRTDNLKVTLVRV